MSISLLPDAKNLLQRLGQQVDQVLPQHKRRCALAFTKMEEVVHQLRDLEEERR